MYATLISVPEGGRERERGNELQVQCLDICDKHLSGIYNVNTPFIFRINGQFIENKEL